LVAEHLQQQATSSSSYNILLERSILDSTYDPAGWLSAADDLKRLAEMGLSRVGEEEVQSQDRAEDTGEMFTSGKAKAEKQSPRE
jgi:hypothetical protein